MGRAQATAVLVGLAGFTPCLLVAGLAGCSETDAGVVELNWRWVDRDGDPIYPAGQFSPSEGTCRVAARGGTTRVDLRLELAICEEACGDTCEGICEIVPPERFACDAARATLDAVPASPDPYLFIARAVIETPAGPCVSPPPSCIAVPGPRARTVARGLVTDLQVYQIAVDIDLDGDAALDVSACGCD